MKLSEDDKIALGDFVQKVVSAGWEVEFRCYKPPSHDFFIRLCKPPSVTPVTQQPFYYKAGISRLTYLPFELEYLFDIAKLRFAEGQE